MNKLQYKTLVEDRNLAIKIRHLKNYVIDLPIKDVLKREYEPILTNSIKENQKLNKFITDLRNIYPNKDLIIYLKNPFLTSTEICGHLTNLIITKPPYSKLCKLDTVFELKSLPEINFGNYIGTYSNQSFRIVRDSISFNNKLVVTIDNKEYLAYYIENKEQLSVEIDIQDIKLIRSKLKYNFDIIFYPGYPKLFMNLDINNLENIMIKDYYTIKPNIIEPIDNSCPINFDLTPITKSCLDISNRNKNTKIYNIISSNILEPKKITIQYLPIILETNNNKVSCSLIPFTIFNKDINLCKEFIKANNIKKIGQVNGDYINLPIIYCKKFIDSMNNLKNRANFASWFNLISKDYINLLSSKKIDHTYPKYNLFYKLVTFLENKDIDPTIDNLNKYIAIIYSITYFISKFSTSENALSDQKNHYAKDIIIHKLDSNYDHLLNKYDTKSFNFNDLIISLNLNCSRFRLRSKANLDILEAEKANFSGVLGENSWIFNLEVKVNE